MTILLSFLGTGTYQDCRYSLGGTPSSKQAFFSVALAEHLRPDRVLSLQTSDASEKNGSALDAAFASLEVDHQCVAIAEGKSTDELWEIFAALTEHVPEGCTLHLDITHGFRSLPLLGFIAVSYLRVARDIKLGGIHYGAWEARNESGVAPTFDLTPFLSLLDWTSAAEDFLSTGSARRLGGLLSGVQQSLWQKQNASESKPDDLPRKLKSLGQSLQQTSDNLLLLRTGALAGGADQLDRALEQAREEAAVHATPFLQILCPVEEHLTRFRSTDLETLRDLVEWLAVRNQVAAALTLANEWITSYLMVLCGEQEHHSNHRVREPYSLAATLLGTPDAVLTENEAARAARQIAETLRSRLGETEQHKLKVAIGRIRKARNDLNHAGFNDAASSAAALTSTAKEIAAEIQSLPLSGRT